MRTVPYFSDTFPSSRRPAYPRQKGELKADVVIVGGGLTGTACALAFATSGVRVAVIEQDRIGAAGTAGSAGLLRQDFDASFQTTASRHGLRAARHLWQSARRASLDFAAALRRFGIRCDLTAQDQVLFTRNGAEAARRLKREYEARRAAGLEATWLNGSAFARETALEASGGIRIKQDTIDPYRACMGLAAAAAARGAAIFERTNVRRVRAGRKIVTVKTASGLVTAEAVVIATGAPIDDLHALRRHFVAREAYMVVTDPLPALVRRQVGKRTASLIDVPSTPDVDFPHMLRWMKDERVLFAGDDQAPTPARARDKTLTQRAGQLMYELSTWYPAISGTQPAWAWNLVHHESVDGLPVIGLHRNFPRHLFALGHGRHGAGVAWLAARLLVRLYRGESAKGDELFGFGRIL